MPIHRRDERIASSPNRPSNHPRVETRHWHVSSEELHCRDSIHGISLKDSEYLHSESLSI